MAPPMVQIGSVYPTVHGLDVVEAGLVGSGVDVGLEISSVSLVVIEISRRLKMGNASPGVEVLASAVGDLASCQAFVTHWYATGSPASSVRSKVG